MSNIESWERQCLQVLRREGMPEGERPDVWVLSSEFLGAKGDERPRKLFVWLAESLLYAYREMMRGERCDWRVVLRVYGQASSYKGELEGMAAMGAKNSIPASVLYDALTNLQCDLEIMITSPQRGK